MATLLEGIKAQFSVREQRYFQPDHFVNEDFKSVYVDDKVVVGAPLGAEMLLNAISRDHTIIVVGSQFGDEGKGRIIDNRLQQLLTIKGINLAYVVRFQGGANAGHTVYTDKGIKIPLHQVPSGVNEDRAVGVMDSGMVIHMEDLMHEIVDAENIVGDLRGKLILSEEAKLVTDLERAEEVLNRGLSEGKSAGGTGRGMRTGYGNDMLGLGTQVRDLMEDNWKEVYGARYDRYEKEFVTHGYDLSSMDVPNLRATRDTKKAQSRKLGSRAEFLDRLEGVRKWYKDRDASQPDEPSMIQNTFILHGNIYQDINAGVLFEGAQAIGLHFAIGRLPDVTSSDTSVHGVVAGTKRWTPDDIREKIGVMKITYMSSVGAAHMATDLMLPRQAVESTEGFTEDQRYGLWIRDVANERGTTTGRYRDICLVDFELMRYNIRMGGIQMLAGTHLDIAREDLPIKVCTHYIDKKTRQVVNYQPGIRHLENVEPVFIELPGWDGEAAQRARSFVELPDNAKRFLAFMQAQTATPIVAVTNGPQRDQIIEIAEPQTYQLKFPGVSWN